MVSASVHSRRGGSLSTDRSLSRLSEPAVRTVIRRERVGAVFDRLHHVQLAMPPGEEQAARAFFGDVLGMMEVQKPPALAARGGAWFRAGGVELHLGVEADFRAARKAHPGILVQDLDGVVDRLRDAGQDVTWDDEFPGFRRVYAYDPFGNRLEFLEASPALGAD